MDRREKEGIVNRATWYKIDFFRLAVMGLNRRMCESGVPITGIPNLN